ncbi:MAG TPA: hypothetical protein VFB66_23330 [Tepidisphaeraceae bacterium]|nr:hypothetical protein [Tepidisphaeraceae bacterium]
MSKLSAYQSSTAFGGREAPESAAVAERARSRPTVARAACFLACVAFSAVAMIHFHDQQWNGYDDGAYLHVADRIVAGEVLNRDVADHHAGYVNFANALALRLFGNDAVSLRYPLVVMGVINAVLAFWVLVPAGLSYATAGSVATTCLSFVQFMNPTANWYALTLTFVIAAVMAWTTPGSTTRYFTLGLLVGLVFLFRQLTGVFVAMGVLFYVLLELPQHSGGGRAWAGKGLMLVMAAGLAGYLLRKSDVITFLMYGVWPLAMLAWGVARSRAANGDVLRLLVRLSAGAVVASMPLLAYHLYHRSLGAWFHDTVVAAAAMNTLSYLEGLRYWRSCMLNGARSVVRPDHFVDGVVGLFWLVMPALPVLAGAMAAWLLWTRPGNASAERENKGPRLGPLPVLGVFYFLVALHFQKWVYFFFGAPMLLVGLLAMMPLAAPLVRRGVVGAVFALSLTGFMFLAGPVRAVVPGREQPLVGAKEHRIPRVSLRLTKSQADLCRQVVAVTERETAEGDPILVAPLSPEIYYVTGRRNPTRSYNMSLDLRSPADVERFMGEISRDGNRPRLVFYDPENNYNTPQARALMERIKERYQPAGRCGPFEVYKASDRAAD